MRFRCSNCGTDYHAQSENALRVQGGSMAHLPWFRDERGLNISATLCLRCGTIHATSGSPGKALFTFGQRMLKVHFYLPPDRIKRLLADPNVTFPQTAIDLLVERGHLVVSTSSEANGAPTNSSAADLFESLQRAYAAATTKYAMYCQMVRRGEATVETLNDFVAEGLQLFREGNRSAHATSAQVLKDALSAGVSPEEVVDIARTVLKEATIS